MKLTSQILSLFTIILLASCNSDENNTQSLKTSSLGKTISLQEHEGTRFASPSEDQFEIEITQILDSRCPQDVVCIWAGQIIVSFKLPTDAIAELCLGGDSNCYSTIEFEYDSERYELILLDVKPYPTTTNGAEKRTVEFTVIKK